MVYAPSYLSGTVAPAVATNAFYGGGYPLAVCDAAIRDVNGPFAGNYGGNKFHLYNNNNAYQSGNLYGTRVPTGHHRPGRPNGHIYGTAAISPGLSTRNASGMYGYRYSGAAGFYNGYI